MQQTGFFLGKGRHVRVFPLLVVAGHEAQPIKIAETKGSPFVIFTLGCIYMSIFN